MYCGQVRMRKLRALNPDKVQSVAEENGVNSSELPKQCGCTQSSSQTPNRLSRLCICWWCDAYRADAYRNHIKQTGSGSVGCEVRKKQQEIVRKSKQNQLNCCLRAKYQRETGGDIVCACPFEKIRDGYQVKHSKHSCDMEMHRRVIEKRNMLFTSLNNDTKEFKGATPLATDDGTPSNCSLSSCADGPSYFHKLITIHLKAEQV